MKLTAALCASFLVFSGFAAGNKSIQIMSYNVENLFDTQKDEGKNDWTFLPNDFPGKKEECNKIKSKGRQDECRKIDWTEEALEVKLSQIKKVIDENEYGKPDLLGLVEVENANVVGQLAKKLGYEKFVVTNGPDERGIDVALLYKESSDLKFVDYKELPVPVTDPKYPTRPILEVNFMIQGKHALSAFVNHWPSQGAGPESRVLAAKVLKTRIDEIKKKNPKANIVAMGDFNVIPGDVPHPFHTVLLDNQEMMDVRWTLDRDRDISFDVKNRLPPGTYFFDHGMNWNDLDHFFISKNLLDKSKDTLQLQLDSFNILAPEFATTEITWDNRYYMSDVKIKKVPWAYDHSTTKKSKAGFSDHFPITILLKY